MSEAAQEATATAKSNTASSQAKTGNGTAKNAKKATTPAKAPTQNEPAKKGATSGSGKKGGKLVAILIRSTIDLNPQKRDTLQLLKLTRKNSAALLNDTPSTRGMIRMVKDSITWGEANDETIKLFNDEKVVNLHPPRKGFGRKGIKVPFSVGGGLGYRAEKINDLIQRMRP